MMELSEGEEEIPETKEERISQPIQMSQNSQRSVGNELGKATPLRTPGKMSRAKVRPQEVRERLMVERIILQDFKSYAGKKIIGPFDKSFTSVVGPNGSGKSNLIESLLFVFGKRANWMRLKQLHQLIHNSGQENTPTKASVEVYFQEIKDKEGEDYEVIPGSKFTVKRTVNKTNQTHYEINSKKVRQEDVTDLLKKKGIDLNNNRFLILQGEVEQISLMKPKSGDPDKPGLLEYLEDIIGSNQYKEKIEELDERYENQNEQRREKGERMRMTEQELEKLNEGKNIAVDYIRREKNIYSLQNILHQIQRYNYNKELVSTEEKYESMKEEIDLKKQEFKDKIQENKSLLKEWKKKREELEETRTNSQKCKQEFEKLQERDQKLQSDIKFETENQVKLEAKKEELEQEYSKLIDDGKEMKKELPNKEKELEKLTAEREEEEEKLTHILNKLKTSNQKLVKQKGKIQGQLQPFLNQVKNYNQQISVFDNKIQMLQQDDNELLKENIQKNEDEINKNKQEIEDANVIVNQVKEAQVRIHEIKENLYGELKEREEDQEKVAKQMHDLQRQLDQNRAQANENRQRNQIVSELIKAQSNREVQGIHGRLGDLGAINQTYDVAITTACGYLDNIVVDNQESGQQCIQYLRERRLGRSNFMPINVLYREWVERSKQPFQAPPNSKRLFDLLKIKNEKYIPIFYYALRDTLVCDNIDVATQIAYGRQRYRVVTLDGKLIDLSGTMSGGGKPKRGGMSSQLKNDLSDEELNHIRHERQKLDEVLQEIKQGIDHIRSQIQNTTKDETSARAVLQERQMDVEMKTQVIQDLIKKIQNQKKQLKDSDKSAEEIEKLQNQKEKLEAEREDKEQECQKIKIELDKVEEELRSLGGDEMREQEAMVKSFRVRHEKLENETNKMRSKIQNLDKNLKKTEKEEKDAESKLGKVTKKIDHLKVTQQELEEEAMNVLSKMKVFTDKLEQMEKEQQQKDEKKNELDTLITKMSEDLKKMNGLYESLSSEIKRFKHQITVVTEKLETYRKNYQSIIEGYDFLNELDEIANFSTDPSDEKKTEEKEKQGEMDIEQPEDESSNNLDQTAQEQEIQSNKKNKKRINIGLDHKEFLKKDVNEDLTNEELEQCNRFSENFNYKLRNEEAKLQNLKEETNIETINEFKDKYKDYKVRKAEFDGIKKALADIKVEMDQLKKQRFEEFMTGFNKISQKLKETYQTLTNGGDSELELIDSLDPFSDGVNFTVRPPKKSWKQIGKLSGGEKTLSSLSLIFALHYYRPTPLYFMDEIDAALDFKNVSVVGHYVKERTKDAQFIIISLRNNMFELAKKLVGVYKTFDQTKTIAIIPEKVQAKLEQNKKKKNDNDNKENQMEN